MTKYSLINDFAGIPERQEGGETCKASWEEAGIAALLDIPIEEFNVRVGLLQSRSESGDLYLAYALIVTGYPPQVQGGVHRALERLARHQIKKASEKGTVVVRTWPEIESFDDLDDGPGTSVYMRYAVLK